MNLVKYLQQFDSLLSEVAENLETGEQYEFLQAAADRIYEVMEEGPNDD